MLEHLYSLLPPGLLWFVRGLVQEFIFWVIGRLEVIG